nr:MAG TPA: minor tail protein [Caudoviricetes sp.]
MALEKFSYTVEAGLGESFSPKIYKVQFGDGYIQRSKKGINNILREFSVTYKGVWGVKIVNGKPVVANQNAYDEMSAVEEFLLRHEGYKAFLWDSFRKHNQGNPIKVVCENWSIDRQNGYGTINMTFMETL